MSKALFIALFGLFAVAMGLAADAESRLLDDVQYASIVAEISEPQAPVVSERHIIFTAPGNARHTAIAFEHENYAILHDFKRLAPRGSSLSAASERSARSTLFYIMELPPDTSEIRYRIVRDGLWMPDPLNPRSVYDFETGARVSVLQVEPYSIYKTASAGGNLVRFVYEGESGEIIRLAGTFNNWDPFMYEMKEVARGRYELLIPLPKGTWYYAFFHGTTQIRDESSAMKVYTKDGRIASVITVE